MPGAAVDALYDLVARLRPWSNEEAVAGELRTWATCYWKVTLSPGLADGAGDVAADLREFGRCNDPDLDSEAMLGIVRHMLVNVAAGRRPADLGSPFVSVLIGWPPRTARRIVHRHERVVDGQRFRDGSTFTGAMSEGLNRYGRQQTLGALVRQGRTIGAARAWVRRHPGRPASEASDPR